MQLLKIGNHIINADLIVSVTFNDENMYVVFAVRREDRAYGITFKGDEATALQGWLERHSLDLLNPPKPERPLASSSHQTF